MKTTVYVALGLLIFYGGTLAAKADAQADKVAAVGYRDTMGYRCRKR